VKVLLASGKRVKQYRIIPKVPTLSSTPSKRTEVPGVADEAASTTSLQFLAHCAINFASILSDDMSVAPKQDIFSKSINAKLQATSYKSHYSYEGWWGVFTCSIYHSYSWMQSLMSLMKTLTLHPTRIKADILNEGNLEGNIVVIYWGFGGKYDCSLW